MEYTSRDTRWTLVYMQILWKQREKKDFGMPVWPHYNEPRFLLLPFGLCFTHDRISSYSREVYFMEWHDGPLAHIHIYVNVTIFFITHQKHKCLYRHIFDGIQWTKRWYIGLHISILLASMTTILEAHGIHNFITVVIQFHPDKQRHYNALRAKSRYVVLASRFSSHRIIYDHILLWMKKKYY